MKADQSIPAPSLDKAQLDEDGVQAYLFKEEGTDRRAVAIAKEMLPETTSSWSMECGFILGVHHIMPIPHDPEPVLRGILNSGHYVWDAGNVPKSVGTGQ
jgi:hypothetical protein